MLSENHKKVRVGWDKAFKKMSENGDDILLMDDNIDLDILVASAKFLSLGIDARHLKTWRLAADQEVSLFETRVVPLMRQRNPAARHDAMSLFAELVDQGGRLRAALIAAQTRDHIDKR